MNSADIWRLLAGIALFILGMNFLESALRRLGGRPFKLFLKKQTTHKLRGILGGAAVTGILQSSSIVNLMVLAFVGAGVIKMQNALALMLGSNLGTTFTSWIIATVGFKINIESLSLPITGVAGIFWALTSRDTILKQWFSFSLGFGLILLGLDFMKDGVEELVQRVDLSGFMKYHAIIFILVGMAITSLVQSSGVTVALVLSALNVGAIDLTAGAAIVLGAEIGTTIKLLIASVGDIPDKKRVALGNFLFNVLTAVVVLLILRPLLYMITDLIGIHDRVIALVFFQSTVNVISILLFFPLLAPFGRFLENRFREKETDTGYIHKVRPDETELGIVALQKEIRRFIFRVTDFLMNCYKLNLPLVPPEIHAKEQKFRSVAETYDFIKVLHGDIQQYAARLRSSLNEPALIEQHDKEISALRNAMYAGKSMKDAWQDAEMLENSSNEFKFGFYKSSRSGVENFLEEIIQIIHREAGTRKESLVALYQKVAEQYTNTVKELYHGSQLRNLPDKDITTIINYNRELYTAKKSLLFAVKDQFLSEQDADIFNEMPGFIR